jgi:TetR/AcrR family transcriptional regulator, ethionamide resistance regulator
VPDRDDLLRRAYALGGMVDQYLVTLFFGSDATLAALSQDRDALVDTFTTLWTRGLAP